MSILNIKERCRRKLIKNGLRLSRADSGGFILVDAILNEIRHMMKQLESQKLKTKDEESNTSRVDYSWLMANNRISIHSSPLKPTTCEYSGSGDITMATITNQQRLFSEIHNLCLTLNSAECGQVLRAFRAIQNSLDKTRTPNIPSVVNVEDGVDVSDSLSNTDEKSQETLSIEITSLTSSSENLISSLDAEDTSDDLNDKSSFDFLSKTSPTKLSHEGGSPTQEARPELFDGKHLHGTMKLFQRPLVAEDCFEMLESLETFLRGVHKIILDVVAQRRLENKTKKTLRKNILSGTRSLSLSAKSFASRSSESDKVSDGKLTSSWSNLKIRPGSRATVMPSSNECL